MATHVTLKFMDPTPFQRANSIQCSDCTMYKLLLLSVLNPFVCVCMCMCVCDIMRGFCKMCITQIMDQGADREES